ncbi:disintegrin and metalloproteinase domain-containing protein 17-like isoform X1 [Biomphalaria glabrata]
MRKLITLWCLFKVLNVNVHCIANLKHYETFSEIGIVTKVKRSYNDVPRYIKKLKFNIFNRDFHLHLISGTDILAKDFEAFVIHNDKETSFRIDQTSLFSGFVIGSPDVKVTANVDGDGWYIQIVDVMETYVIEPSQYLLTDRENPKNDSFIAYRASDITTGARCGNDVIGTDISWLGLGVKSMADHMEMFNTNYSRKHKRASDKNTCLLQVFADYNFFKKRCRKSLPSCSSVLISMVQKADKIFRDSVFIGHSSSTHKGYGLQIQSMAIYTSYSVPIGRFPDHFNQASDWTAITKLKKFAAYMGFRKKKYCLSTLLSGDLFPDRILGLAMSGTVCSPASLGRSQPNSNVVSAEDVTGLVPSLQMTLVLAHEIGHNFGSEHDPDTAECNPPENTGGNYLMWPIAVNGEERNNNKFSPCASKHIGQKLEEIGCLVDKSNYQEMCGNGKVEDNEECDNGDSNFDPGSCCNEVCKLRTGAICSDENTQCCLNCQVAPNGTRCFDGLSESCKQDSYCNGKNFTCSEAANLPDFTPCLQSGGCYQGECRGFCELKSIKTGLALEPCLCRELDENACKWCCYNNSDPNNPGPCMPHSNYSYDDGRKCFAGYCESGKCVMLRSSSIVRIFNFIRGVSLTRLAKFMKSNIVLAVIVTSLPFYFGFIMLSKQLDENAWKKSEMYDYKPTCTIKIAKHSFSTRAGAVGSEIPMDHSPDLDIPESGAQSPQEDIDLATSSFS